MVGTRHCCWGECKTDSRYPEKWPESLKELEKSGQKVFIPFPKPAKDLAKCKRWLAACSRQFFKEKNVNKNKVKTCKRWQVAHLHRRETFETFYILLHWGDLFQGSYSLKFERWYRFYIADQDTARYSLCSARENCVSGAEPLKCLTDNLFSSRVFLLNL